MPQGKERHDNQVASSHGRDSVPLPHSRVRLPPEKKQIPNPRLMEATLADGGDDRKEEEAAPDGS